MKNVYTKKLKKESVSFVVTNPIYKPLYSLSKYEDQISIANDTYLTKAS